MDANEKNLNVAMNLLEGILAKAKFEKDGTKNYSIYFPVFDEEDGKILAKFPVFEITGNEAALKGWQVYSLDDYRLDVFLMDNQNIVYDDYNTVNFRNPEDKEKLLYFITIFLKVQEFKKSGRGIDVVPENKALVEDLIGDFENNIVDSISEDVNRIYNYEIEYEDDDVEAEDNTSILDSIDSLDDYEDNSTETLVPEVEDEEEVEEVEEIEDVDNFDEVEEIEEVVEDEEDSFNDLSMFETEEDTTDEIEEFEEVEEIEDIDETEEVTEDESILPGMNFEDDDLSMFENTADEVEEVEEVEEVAEDESILPGMNFEDDDLAMFENTADDANEVEKVEEIAEDENILPGMNFEDDDLAMFENTTDDVEEIEEVVEDEDDSFDDLAMFETEDEDTVEEVVEDEEDSFDDLAMFETEDDTANEEVEEIDDVVEDEDDSFDDLEMFEVEETVEEVDDEDDFEEIVDESEDTEETLLPGMGFDEEFLNKYDTDAETEEDEIDNVEDTLEEIEELDSIIDNSEDDYEDDEDSEEEIDEIVDLSELEDEDEITEVEEVETDDLDLDIGMDDEEEIDAMFESVVGMEEVKEKVLGFQKYVDFVKSMNIASADFNLAFVGNKGTGKSVIANIVTEMLYDMDMIAVNKLTKANRKELCTCHHKGNVIDNVIEAAMGGVLLIDEVCRCEIDLGPVLTAKLAEAMDTGLIVIFSGCNEGMDEFLKVNKDIASKIAYRIDFADYTAEDLSNIVISKAEFEGLNLNDDAKEEIKNLMKVFENAEGIDSRFTTRLFQKMIVKHSNNSYAAISISKDDVPTVNEMLDFVTANENVIIAETVKAVYNSNVKLLVVENEKVATLKTKANMLDTKSGLYNKLVGLVVRLAAEEVYFGEYTNNTEDLKEASCLAKYMSEFGLIRLNKNDHEMESQVYEADNKLMAKALEDAKAYVNKNKKNLDNAIEYVNKNAKVTGEEIVKALEPKKEVKKEVKETKKAVKEVKETKPAKKVAKTEKTVKETKATKKAEPKATKAAAKTTKAATKKTAKK